MTHMWTWGGKYFGYREGDDLWTHSGHHVGRFYDDEIADQLGRYLGELMNGNRLIVNTTRRSSHYPTFAPRARRVALMKCMAYVGYVVYMGYEDFPPPENFA